MIQRVAHQGTVLLDCDGFGWARTGTPGRTGAYTLDLFGVTYTLEKRTRSVARAGTVDTPTTGWYLYSTGSDDGGNFFGQWCATLRDDAIQEASRLIRKADLRGSSHVRDPRS